MTQEGTFADALPPRSTYPDPVDWNTLAKKAQTRPGKPLLAATDVRLSKIKALQQRRTAPFVEPDGRIKVTMRDSYVADDGIRYGTVWFTWHPTAKGKK